MMEEKLQNGKNLMSLTSVKILVVLELFRLPLWMKVISFVSVISQLLILLTNRERNGMNVIMKVKMAERY